MKFISEKLNSIGKSKVIDRTSLDIENVNQKVQKIKKLINKNKYDEDVARYIRGTLDLIFQGMLDIVTTREQPAQISYKDMENFECQVILTKNHYANTDSVHICFPIIIKKSQI